MKYTNEYIRNSYSFQMTAVRVSLILVFIGAIMIAWGFADAYHKVNNRFPMEQIFDISGNQADRIAFIEINDISEKIAEDKYGTCYHLIFDSDNTYLAGMNDEQYASIKEDISNNHTSNLEGKTLLIIDKETLNIMSDYSYIGEDVYLNVGDVSYFSVLKDRVQLIIGGVLTFLFFIGAIVYSSELNGYRKIVAISDISPEELDAEANDTSSVFTNTGIMITPSFITGTNGRLIVFKYNEIEKIRYYYKDMNYIIEIEATDKKIYELYKGRYINESDVRYLFEEIKERNQSVEADGEFSDEEYEE